MDSTGSSQGPSTTSTSLVKYLQIMPSEEIPELSVTPNIPLSSLSIELIHNITVEYYRKLYNNTGGMWLWTDRRVMSDEKLYSIISAPDVSIHVLKVDGEEAGYFELEWKKTDSGEVNNVEVSYFGLMPGFIGKRIGPWFLNEALKLIRNKTPNARIWVHTCSWDHPKAYDTYVKAGFKWYKEEVEPIQVPESYVRQK